MAFEQRPLFDQQHPADNAHITEITLSSQAQLSRTLLSAMLGQLCGSTDPRWLCWVADRPVKPLLDANSPERGQRILQVVVNEGSLCNIAARALERGKSHTVAVLLKGPLGAAERQLLTHAAKAGQAECLVIHLQD